MFAVVGDTRPPSPDDTSNYPTSIITKIFQDVVAESPAPAFVIGTGDYMFSNSTAQQQLDMYMTARGAYSGPFYPAMGNHECNGYTAGNCASSPTSNMSAFMSTMLGPINETKPYYVKNISAPDNSWTAKFVFVACNAWDSTQASWLQTALAASTTYTFVIRHEPDYDMSSAPCSASQTTIDGAALTLLITGHSHEYKHVGSAKEIVNGLGGAPLTTGTNYGYTMITRNTSDGTLTVETKDYMSGSSIDTFKIAASGAGA